LPSFPRSRVGFLINPVAGLGGAVGLKGTDGLVQDALARGAIPRAGERAKSCLVLLAEEADGLRFFTSSGEMGETALKECDLSCDVVYRPSYPSTAHDTIATCREILQRSVDLILFCGGDGTARDVASIAGQTPMLGIPAGVKMHSGVFAVSPEAAAELALLFLKGDLQTRETEIVDVDEELYRQGELQTRLFALARTPYKPVLVQDRKRIYSSKSEEDFKDQIAQFAREFMIDGSAYILGAGTTTARIAELQGIEKTLLGVDVIKDGRLLLRDASEEDLLQLLERERMAKVIVSPIGAQGFILGRGSQQISFRVMRLVGARNLIIVSTPHKLAELDRLLVDTGDPDLDRDLSGSRQVVTGYRIAQRKEVMAAEDIVSAVG
jgi:predicted polyphosphate/ATP-dependent NAD kinase